MRLLLASFLLLAACGGSSKQPTVGNVAGGSVTTSIRSIDFLNRSYDSGEGGTVTVKDGAAELEADPEVPDIHGWFNVTAPVYGDVDGDGVEEAIVITAYNGGGTGIFDSGQIYALRPGSAEPVKIGEIPGGDRGDGGLNDIQVEGGKVLVERNLSADGDGACCPSKLVKEVWHCDAGGCSEDERARETIDNPNYQGE